MHPVINFRCGRKPENTEKTRDFLSKCSRTLPTSNQMLDAMNQTLTSMLGRRRRLDD